MKKKKKLQYEKVGKLANNTRYDITYDKNGKAKVKYSYVSKDYSEKNRLPYIITLIIALVISLLFFFLILNPMLHRTHEPISYNNCSTTPLGYNQSKTNLSSIYYLNISCIDSQGNYTWSFIPDKFKFMFYNSKAWTMESSQEVTDKNQIVLVLSFMGVLIAILFFFRSLPYLIHTMIKIKPGKNKIMDKIKKWEMKMDMKNVHYRWKYVFKKCPKNNIIEIPVFNNDYLDYNATKDFSTYLKRIEVKEHKFFEEVYKKNPKKRYGWKHQDGKFYCKFYFSQNPRSGKLEVKWK